MALPTLSPAQTAAFNAIVAIWSTPAPSGDFGAAKDFPKSQWSAVSDDIADEFASKAKLGRDDIMVFEVIDAVDDQLTIDPNCSEAELIAVVAALPGWDDKFRARALAYAKAIGWGVAAPAPAPAPAPASPPTVPPAAPPPPSPPARPTPPPASPSTVPPAAVPSAAPAPASPAPSALAVPVVSSIGPVDLVHLVNTVQVNDRELVSAAMAGASAAAAAKKGPAEFNFGWRTLAVLAVIALVMVTAALFAARDRDESPGPQRITAAEASGPLIFGEHEIKLVIKPRPAATP